MSLGQPRPLLTLRLALASFKQVHGPNTEVRLLYEVKGGQFQGSDLKGHIMPVMGDWVSVVGADVSMDVRVCLRTDEGENILMSYDRISGLDRRVRAAVADNPDFVAARRYFGVSPRMETSSPRLQWLAQTNLVGIGIRDEEDQVYLLFDADQLAGSGAG